jgi:translation elongation factor EF-Tu-like GTPase
MAFSKFVSDASRLRPEDVLRMDDKIKQALRALSIQDLVALNRQILQHVEDQASKITPARQKKIVAGVEQYLDFLRTGGQTEVVADFINLTERDDFGRASGLVLASPAIMKLFTDYIAKVKI